jgi:hypothetical protein|tara:strand:- start:116 stop:958 length:843 start_codon:yes stop_codon:yes gene_type:complete
MKTQINLMISVFLVLISLSFISAVIVDSVSISALYPGQTSSLTVSVKNTLDDDVEDVSFILNLDDTSFTTSESSEDSEDEIREGKKENFNFVLKAPANMKPGDYNIPYEIKYTDVDENKTTKTGSFGITISAKTELDYNIELEDNIVDEMGKLSIKIINSGLGDIGFVSVNIVSASGFEILSSEIEYVGTVSSDDFESATFDVLFKKTSASLTANIKYKDFDNKEETKTISLPVKVYSREKALELGLIKKDNKWVYGVIAGLVLIWFIYRRIKKKRKNRG